MPDRETVFDDVLGERHRLDERRVGEAVYGPAPEPTPDVTLADLQDALTAGKILCYAQGFTMTAAAGVSFGWDLQLPSIARVWRAGCIIRSSMLDAMAQALTEDPTRNLILAPRFTAELALTEHAMHVRGKLAALLARDDDRRPRREIGRKHAAQTFDDGTGIPFGEQTQPADDRDVLAGKRTIGCRRRGTCEHRCGRPPIV